MQPGIGPRFGVTELLRCIQIHMESAGYLLISLDISCFNNRFHDFTAIIYRSVINLPWKERFVKALGVF